MKELKLLLWKNFKIMSREKIATLVEIMFPTTCVIVFAIFRVVIKREDIQNPVIYEPFDISGIPKSVREDASVIYYSPTNRVTDSLMNIVLEKFFTSRGLNYTVKAFDREDALVRAYVKSRDEDPDSLSRGPLLAGIVFDNIGSKKLPSNIKVKFDASIEEDFDVNV
ncbi:unnamed protein product, partial [Allacma fusca]